MKAIWTQEKKIKELFFFSLNGRYDITNLFHTFYIGFGHMNN